MGFSRVITYENDHKWAWKFVLRLLAIFFNIAGMVLTAWALAMSGLTGSYYYTGDIIAYVPWNLITFSLSLIWCLTNICILLSRSRPIHPGANVGCDLFLWLAFIVTGAFSVIGVISSLHQWYDPSSYGDYSGDSGYYPNGTFYTVSPSRPAPPCPGFDTCSQKDAIEARLKQRGTVIAAASAFALLMALVHFALFVSACRYTHERRQDRDAITNEKVTKEATVIAREIIAQMAREGRLPAMQQPLLATEGTPVRQSTSTPPALYPTPQQQQHQPVPRTMVHGANQDDVIFHAPRGQSV